VRRHDEGRLGLSAVLQKQTSSFGVDGESVVVIEAFGFEGCKVDHIIKIIGKR
jgi:hypothetical protein